MQAIKAKKIKCNEYCLSPNSTITDALENFKKEFPEALVVDIKINSPFIIFFYTDDTYFN